MSLSLSDGLPDVNTHPRDDPTAEEASSSDLSLEIDSEQSDERDSTFSDSAVGDNQSTYTMSATSSVFNFRYENGRRYHAYAEGKYPVPNDEIEADRLDLQHHAFRLTLDGKLYRAPITDQVQNVLDVGCGTGIWAIEFADEHPSARVLGTDLSPIQPDQVPPNCEFLIDDCEQDWIFRQMFDYIHSRAMVAAVKDWDRFFEQAYANLKPGGYLECQELTFPIRCMDPGVTAENSPLIRWSEYFLEAAKQIGVDGTGPRHFSPQLRNAGFTNINVNVYKWPVGKWAKGARFKLLGRFVYDDLMDWLPSSSLRLFTRILKWSREEVEVFLSECRAEARRKDRHYYGEALFWYARKPGDANESGHEHDVVQDEESIDRDEEDQGNHAKEPEAVESVGTEQSAPPR
ncbi:S-adenosyl-L-methionine-dependent methyltransferase [Stemphylium lycopersici]|uniref:S-adenosyl-L-methionine-dependent methyltransferase n=1 Tax=Stemphylium lycopersici TaxID=183478 RepID=A0A364N5R9_STELY|nr:S-adenosyl-L-methionine-dependent methyltransferase [Stemphylium lycopersici]